MGAGRTRFMRGPSWTYASETNSLSTSRSSLRFCALAMADCSTFSTVGAIRLLTVRSVVMAAPACLPRIISTTRSAFCGETRMYLASALIWVLGSMVYLYMPASLCRLGGFLGGRFYRMAFEHAGGRKLAQLVSHHVFGDVHRNEFLAVVDRHGVTDELRKDGGAARPRAHHFLFAGGGEHNQLGFQVRVGKRPFFDRSTHMRLPFFALVRDNPLVGALVIARFETASGLAPGSDRVTAAGGFAFTAAMRVIHRVHGDAAVVGHLAQPTLASGFAEGNVFVIEVAHLSNGGHAFERHAADLARRQFQQRGAAFLGNQLRLRTGRARHLPALAGTQLDVMDDGAGRHIFHRQGVAHEDVGLRAGHQLL